MNVLMKAINGRSEILNLDRDRDIFQQHLAERTPEQEKQFAALLLPILTARSYFARALKVAEELGLDVRQAYENRDRPSAEETNVNDLNARRFFADWMDDYDPVSPSDDDDFSEDG